VTSPWERALGESVAGLHPSLRAYFGQIPAGSVGRGSGTFETVGTPRRWLWPVLAVLGRDGSVFAVWQKNVAFTVENRAVGDAVHATRTFFLAGGTRVMQDRITFGHTGLVDTLGRRGSLAARLVATVSDGRLELRSTTIGLRFGPLRLRLAGRLAPVVSLSEEHAGANQRVTLRVTAPLVGLLYEYAGDFSYIIEPETATVS
jgi:hypothetical protein